MQYRIRIPVELFPGEPFEVKFTRDSQQWANLSTTDLKSGRVKIPNDQFRYDKCVPDEVCALWSRDVLTPVLSRKIPRGCILIVLESPHCSEYTPDFHPLGPLRLCRSRHRLYSHLPRLLKKAKQTRGHMVLCNPIQFQTSLHRLMTLEAQGDLQDLVRNAVWRELYQASRNNVRVFEADFLRRLDDYQPALIINACTEDLRQPVLDTLKTRKYPVRTVNAHPSDWGLSTDFI